MPANQRVSNATTGNSAARGRWLVDSTATAERRLRDTPVELLGPAGKLLAKRIPNPEGSPAGREATASNDHLTAINGGASDSASSGTRQMPLLKPQ